MYNVLACGSNGKYQLGIDDDIDRDELVAVKFRIGGEITLDLVNKPMDIVCGGNHSLILFDNGEVYGAGDNLHGQLGLDEVTIPMFKKVPGTFKLVSAGWEFSVLVTTNNEVLVSGQGAKGEIGLGKDVKCTSLAKLGTYDVDSVKSCMNHTIISTSQGFYGWGVSKNGKLGITSEKVLYEPTQLDFDGYVMDYGLGRDFTVIKTENGMKILGKFNYDQDIVTTSFKTMWSSIHFLENNQIFSFGNNSHGQFYPESDLPIDSYTVGSEHGLIISNGKVYAWGWGEHGNCGKLHGDDVVVNQLQMIYCGSEKPIMIRGGLATSWVVVEK